jgi:hypothetical protein
MATATLPSSPFIPQFTITSEEIARYAELCPSPQSKSHQKKG